MFKMFGTGNLVKDPEEITTASGLTVCRMLIASNERYTKEDGTRPTQYFTVIAWRKLAENCLKYLKKGSKISVVGNPQNRSYEASDGTKKYVFELVAEDIEFLSSKKSEENAEQKEQQPEFEQISQCDLPF